ncbi:MAG: IS256 family transposase [Planctomicrobium sp.]|jgi:putative transposase|nr:IS256 family transposase [Planctomicrobium sp.]
MNKTTTTTTQAPVQRDSRDQSLDPEVLAFRANFESRSPLDEIIREGARRMLQTAIDAEVEDFIATHSQHVDEQGRRQVVRNGHLPSREILTGAGPLEVQQPRVRDKSSDKENRVFFSPNVLPPYLKKSKTIEELIPWLYLKGVSTGDFAEALQALVGEQAKGLSANVIVKLKEKWSQEYEEWSKRDLTDKQYVYIWADGIHVKVRLEDDANKKQCMLVVIGATPDGKKELLAIQDGYRESEQSWNELLLDLKNRGLEVSPKLAIADGALGFWAALRKISPETKEQRCTVHKTANVLNKLPKSVQPRAKSDLHEIWNSATREDANKAFDHFLKKYEAKYEGAAGCLKKDRDELLTFYDFPAEQWAHLRTTNPIESAFATVRLRHKRTKGSGTRRTSLAMIYKLAQSAAKNWRRLRGHQQIIHIIEGRSFQDGILKQESAA